MINRRMNAKVICVDLEGTISQYAWRRPIMKADLELFHRLIEHDEPNRTIIQNMKEWSQTGYEVTILTAKPEEYRKDVTNWLYNHGVFYDSLVMKGREYAQWGSPKWKLKSIAPAFNNIALVVDDRQDVLEAIRAKYPLIVTLKVEMT